MALAIALIAAACVRSSAVTCDDGTVCREGTVCVAVPDGFGCFEPEEVVCGNHRVEGDEVCDDGNITLGDGCSADCRSDETCGNGRIDPVISIGDDLIPNEQCDDGNLISHDGCSSGCLPESPRWLAREAIPSPRFDAAMATEDTSRRIVLFGGREGTRTSRRFNDTWEWSNGGWTQLLIPLSPVPRSGHAMAYDGTRTVLFGGTTGSATLGDTWLLDGSTWSPHVGANPPGRTNHAMAFMPGVGLVLFGGATEEKNLNDTWIFNGAWTHLDIAGPSPRSRHVMVYDPIHDHVLLTGGADGNKPATSTWTFDGAAWTELAANNTPPVWDASASFDRARGRVVMHGGADSGTLIELVNNEVLPGDSQTQNTYEWNGADWELRDSTDTPGIRFASSGATDPITGRALQYGGAATLPIGSCPAAGCIEVFDATWTWDGQQWVDSAFVANPPQVDHAVTLDPERRRVVVLDRDMRIMELGDGSWQQATATGALPAARSFSAVAFARIGTFHGVLVFGGRFQIGTDTDQTLSYDGKAWAPVTVTRSPPARSHHAMVFDESRGRVVLFGGVSGGTYRNDVWEWDGTTWVEPELLPSALRPEPRIDVAMAYDPQNKNVVLVGGDLEDSSLSGQTWTWDGTEWTRHELALSPPPRRGASMAWDPARKRIVLFGGGETIGNDTWAWNGTAWSFVSIEVPPAARSKHALVSSPTGDGVLSIGGSFGNEAISEVLHLRYLSTTPSEVCRANVDDDGDGASGCDDPDCWSSCAPYCPSGDASCADIDPRCGDGVCDPQRESCGICADCTCILGCGNLVCDPGETATSCPGDC